jgi:hypothetical protein
MAGGEGRAVGNVITNPEGERVEVVNHTPVGTKRPEKPTLRQRPCLYLTSFVKSLPVIFISGIVGWSYYAYMIALVLNAMNGNVAEQVICAVLYHIIFILFFWSYWMTVFTPPGRIPESWFLSKDAISALAAAISEEQWKEILASYTIQMGCNVKQRSVQGAVRYCEKCECIKPDRSHHCSVCEACTLKMDHHCPWVNNCVGFANYKFFLLFLCYALVYCTFIACSSVKYFISFWSDEKSLGSAKYHIIFVFLVSILFSISVSSLFWYHVYLVLRNRSTLEQFRAPVFDDHESDKDGWSLNALSNFREVFGENPLLWPLPIQTHLGDGIAYPHRRAKIFSNYQSIGNPSRPETPNRTLVNPILTTGGTVSASQTIHSNSNSILHSGKASAMSGVASPECNTEAVLDSNGHVRTVSVQSRNELTELVIQ